MSQDSLCYVQTVQEIVKKIEQLIYHDVWDLQELEYQIRQQVLALGVACLNEAFSRLDEELRTRHCATCGGRLHLRRRPRKLATLVGTVQFVRTRGSCPTCNTVVYWLDRELGITAYQGSSRGMAALHASCAASWGYTRSAKMVSQMTGISTPAMSLHRTVNRSTPDDDAARQAVQEASAAVETSGPILVDADGVMIQSREVDARTGEDLDHIEGKVVCIWSQKDQVGRDRWQLTDKRYYATFQQLDHIAKPVYQEVFKRAKTCYPAQQVVVRGDGGAWIRTLYQDWYAQGRLLLDAYHLRKKIHTRLREAFHRTDRERVMEGHRLYRLLRRGNVLTAYHQVSQLSTQTERLRDPVALQKLNAYLKRHHEGMWYPQALAEGIDIGTGAIEKGGDLVICRRFKTRGMRWSRPGAEAVLQYRLLSLNDDWDRYWSIRRTA
jgi:hypothetical protein